MAWRIYRRFEARPAIVSRRTKLGCEIASPLGMRRGVPSFERKPMLWRHSKVSRSKVCAVIFHSFVKVRECSACLWIFPCLSEICLEGRSEEHTSELQSLMRISYAVFCLKKKKTQDKKYKDIN